MKKKQISNIFVTNNPIGIRGVGHIGIFVILGSLIAVTQVFGLSPDYISYDDFFDLVRIEDINVLAISRFEAGFSILSIFITYIFSNNLVVYSCFVGAAMMLKGWVIRLNSLTDHIFLIVAMFYMVRYFPIHELTQLRAACAVALTMVGAMFLWDGKLLKSALIFISAILFQMSAAAIIPALFFTSSKRFYVVGTAIAIFILIFLSGEILISYLGGHVPILDAYAYQGYYSIKPNPFAIQLLIDWGMIIYGLLVWKKLTLLMKRVIFLELVGMALFYGLIQFGVVVHRVRELYSVFWIFFIIDGLRMKATKLQSYVFLLVCIFFYSYIFFISGDFFY